MPLNCITFWISEVDTGGEVENDARTELKFTKF